MLQDSIIHTASLISVTDTLAHPAGASFYLPIRQAWPESYVAVNEISGMSGTTLLSFTDSITNMVIVLGMILFFLFSFNRIAKGSYAVLASVFNYKRLLVIESEPNLQVSRNTLFLFSLIISAFIFANYNAIRPILENDYPTGIIFIFAMAAILLYFLFRRIAFTILNWVNQKSCFKYLDRFFYTYAILSFFLSLFVFFVSVIFPEIPFHYIALYMCILAFLPIFIYFIRGYQLIISNGFSLFFWILYLCTLEILPLLIIAYLILS